MLRAAFTASYERLPEVLADLAKKGLTLDRFLTEVFECERGDFELKKSNVYFLRAEKNEKVVGFLSFLDKKDGSVYVRTAAIEPAYAGLGIVKIFACAILKLKPEITALSLMVRRANTPAMVIYKHCGFTEDLLVHEGYDPAIYASMHYDLKPLKSY